LTAEDVGHAGGVHRDRAGDRVLLLVLIHSHGGHDEHPVGVDHAGHVGLGTADHDAVFPLLHHVDVHIGVLLLAGTQAAVALHVGHGAGHHQVIVLDHDQELLEIVVVMGPQRLIALVCNRVSGVHGVKA